jgi:trehalose 6-phosphate synthase
MSRIVLVSNRVNDQSKSTHSGGLSVVIASILQSQPSIWFGWNGAVSEIDDIDPHLTGVSIGNTLIASLPLMESEFRDYYLGYSNSVLWPVFHDRLDLAQFENGYYSEYRNVNRRFADELHSLLRPDDIVWVHDYHLIPMALELRKLGISNRLGFFLHTSVPPAQSYLAIPEHRELSRALSAYDLIGLQTQYDVSNLIDIFKHSAAGQLLSNGRISVYGRQVKVLSIPVGIDVNYFNLGPHFDTENEPDDIQHRIVGIDRLDYTKGLPQKFRAFGRFLEQNPDYRAHITLSQIAQPTRETLEAYSDIRSELESLSGSINGQYSELGWVPITYINRGVDRQELQRIYSQSNVGLVTPLRDGMNLVCKEYVASQNPDSPGVLILSQFAGAAEQLTDALIVNPYNIDEVAHAIKCALEMPLKERRHRHELLYEKVKRGNSAQWCQTFISALVADGDFYPPHELHKLPTGDQLPLGSMSLAI